MTPDEISMHTLLIKGITKSQSANTVKFYLSSLFLNSHEDN
jgi:hypothetical protein